MNQMYGGSTRLEQMTLLSDAVSRTISPENFTGEKGKAGMATEGMGSKAAEKLGQGWKISPAIAILPGEIFELANIEGSGAIVSMWFGGLMNKNYILRIYWDNQENCSVECPLSDFFGYGWGESAIAEWNKGTFHPLISEPVVVAPKKGMNCFWNMPFQTRCRMTIENRTQTEFMCFYQINYTLQDMPHNIAYFHAQYRQKKPLQKGENYTILDGVSGQGHYVGTVLSVGLNGEGRWWGEGELKFYLDDDGAFPTICTTGTEDYFGGSFNWEVNEQYATYNSPFMGMFYYEKPDGLYNIQPKFSMYRWHLPDPIHFKKNLKITLQDLGWAAEGEYLPRRDDLYSVAFWYQTLPTAPFPQIEETEDMRLVTYPC